MEFVILLRQGVIMSRLVAAELMPNGKLGITHEERSGRKLDNSAFSWGQRASPMIDSDTRTIKGHGVVDDGVAEIYGIDIRLSCVVEIVIIETIEDVSAFNSVFASVVHAERYCHRIIGTHQGTVRRNNLGERKVDFGNILIDEEQKVDNMSLCGLFRLPHHLYTHAHKSKLSTFGNRYFGCKYRITIEQIVDNNLFPAIEIEVGEVAIAVKVDIYAGATTETQIVRIDRRHL